MPKNIVLIISLDTKGPEAEYIKNSIEAQQNNVTIIDTSSLREPQLKGQVSSGEIARAAGFYSGIHGLAKLDRKRASEIMANGATKIVEKLYKDGKLDGIISIGGAMGTFVGTAAMRALPIGVPKIMVSSMASGDMKPYVGSKDIIMFNSVTDIVGGLNRVNRRILANAATAISAMACVDIQYDVQRPLVGVTSFGILQDQIIRIKNALEKEGYEFAAFHGYWGRTSLDELVESGVINGGVIDVAISGLYELLGVDGTIIGSGGLEAAGKMGLPHIIVPGGADLFSVPIPIPSKFKKRKYHFHNPSLPLVRATADELLPLAKFMCEKINKSEGPTAVIIPLKGFSVYGKEGGPLFDSEADMTFISKLKSGLKSNIRYLEVDMHINDPEFAHIIMEVFFEIAQRGRQKN